MCGVQNPSVMLLQKDSAIAEAITLQTRAAENETRPHFRQSLMRSLTRHCHTPNPSLRKPTNLNAYINSHEKGFERRTYVCIYTYFVYIYIHIL